MSQIQTNIQTNAENAIRRAAGDGQSVEQHSLPDQIAADRYVKGEANKSRSGFPLRRMLARTKGASPGS